jgi:hypothetical protein
MYEVSALGPLKAKYPKTEGVESEFSNRYEEPALTRIHNYLQVAKLLREPLLLDIVLSLLQRGSARGRNFAVELCLH